VPLDELAYANLAITIIPMATAFALQLGAIRSCIHRPPSTLDKEA
jgi:hypothetical protein